MARYRPEHKRQTRRKVIDAATSAFRRGGVDAVAIKDVMDDAGLTVGGFYRHFDSKSELIEAAITHGVEQSRGRLMALANDDPAAWLKRFAAGYLSETHRKSLAEGCVLAALASDVARADEQVRATCERSLMELRDALGERLSATNANTDTAWALFALEMGGLLLSRMVASDEVAAEILASCRAAARGLIDGAPSVTKEAKPAAKHARAKRPAKRA